MADGQGLDPKLLEMKRVLKDDFLKYSTLLTIRAKEEFDGADGTFMRLRLNRTQRELHARLEAQRARSKKVRAIVLKGRQQGVSTYIGARFYWRVSHRKGARAFIVSHTDQSTSNLYGMVQTYHNTINPYMRPVTGKANANELNFEVLGSGYKVATAGGKDIGRSDTVQYVHGSEVGFWDRGEKIVSGLIQAVPKGESAESEIILESTAKGLGNVFHSYWKNAVKGDSVFEAIFFPWFLHEEYEAEPPEGWEPPPEWAEYGQACYLKAGLTHPEIKGLTIRQLYWAWRESRELGSAHGVTDPDKVAWIFRQEYPSTASEAFQTAGESPFIRPERVLMARRNRVEGRGPLVLGVDPAREGKDGTGIIDRQGRRMGQFICERWKEPDSMVLCGKLARVIRMLKPARVFIDVGGLGGPIYDRMVELGFGRILEPVNFGSSALGSGPLAPDRYVNRRSEIWHSLQDWFENPAGVQCPDDDEFQMDVTAPAWGRGATRWDSSNRLILESKEHMRERVGFSPDLGDAAALTFASDVLASGPHDADRRDRNEARRTASNVTGY